MQSARPWPTSCGSRCAPPPPGIRPSLISGCPSVRRRPRSGCRRPLRAPARRRGSSRGWPRRPESGPRPSAPRAWIPRAEPCSAASIAASRRAGNSVMSACRRRTLSRPRRGPRSPASRRSGRAGRTPPRAPRAGAPRAFGKRVVEGDDRNAAVLLDLTNSAIYSSSRYAESPIQADDLSVQVLVLDDVLDERGELLGAAEPLGKWIWEVRFSRMSSRASGPASACRPGLGAIVTTRIPFEARSRATGSVIPATPASRPSRRPGRSPRRTPRWRRC